METLVIKNKTIGKGKPIVCVPVMDETKEGIVKSVDALCKKGVAMIEWRVDYFENAKDLNAVRGVLEQLSPLLTTTILVFTFRSKNQGGKMSLSPDIIYDLHQIAAESKVVDFIDVEFFEATNAAKEIRQLKKMGAHVIASHHDFEETPEADIIAMLLEKIKDSGADVVKLALMPQSKKDLMNLLMETEKFHEEYPLLPVVTMSMGAIGCVSRLIGEVTGSCITFGAVGEVSAPGQFQRDELEQMLDVIHTHMA